MKFNRIWDLKVSKQMIYFYNTTKKNGNNYFWNFNLEKAVQLVKILSESYSIRVPKVVSNTKVLKELGKKYWGTTKLCGAYFNDNQTIYMRTRNHIKTIIHEFYHHLDNMTNGMYNSSDTKYYAHIFAEKMYTLIRSGKITHVDAKKKRKIKFIKKKESSLH